MKRVLSPFEDALVSLAHLLSSGKNGLSLKELKSFLIRPIADKNGNNSLQCIELSGKEFVNELKIFLNEVDEA